MFVKGPKSCSGWSILVAEAAIVGTAAAVVLAPAASHVAPLGIPPTQLTAAALPLDPELLDPVGLLAPVAAATGIAEVIENLYLGAEQWVRYGVNLLAWAVGWVPFVGLLAPQLNIFYDLGESIVQSAVFNTVDWLTGSIGFGQALNDFGSDTATAFHDFVTDQVNWIRHFLPPAPPIAPLDAGPAEFADFSAALPDSAATADAASTLDPGIALDVPDLDATLLSLVP